MIGGWQNGQARFQSGIEAIPLLCKFTLFLLSCLCIILQIIPFPLSARLSIRPEIGAFDLFIRPIRKKDYKAGYVVCVDIIPAPKDPQLELKCQRISAALHPNIP